MNTKKYLYLLLFFILSGCVSEKGYWYKEGLTQDELAKVRYICLQQSRQYQNYNSHRSNTLGDAYRSQADSMKPITVNQRNTQAFMRGMATGLTMNDADDREYELYLACMNAYGLYWKVENTRK